MLAFACPTDQPERLDRAVASAPFPLERPLSAFGVRRAPGERLADELTNLRESPSRPAA